MKFSIIIPFYNVEKYIKNCLDSIKNQTYENFEVLIINDGSKENEEKIVKKYLKDERFKYYKKENGGLSDARNHGVKYATGDYLIFVDSDDYISKDLLKKLNKELISNAVDVIKYGIKIVNEKGKIIDKIENNTFKNINKIESVTNILNDKYIEPAWMYAYNFNFWKTNKFEYAKGTIHEDFGLTPIILSKANTITSIQYLGYNYLIRSNSIMTQTSYDKIKKRVNDFKNHYLNHKKIFKENNEVDKILLGYSAFATIVKGRELKDEDRKEYIEFIKNERLVSKITNINFKRFLIKLYLNLFLEKYLRKLNREFYGEK